MASRIGIDVGGTFTDFILTRDDAAPVLHKVLSTPRDPSIGVIDGFAELAAMAAAGRTVAEFAASIETIVHGTTVTTNATLTHTGAKSALLTTAGVRDALEMRRGIREEQYNNAYTNVKPLVPRHLRIGVGGRLDRAGRELEPLQLAEVERAAEAFRREGVQAVSICFMNSYANPAHERAAAALVRRALPDAFLTVSTDLLPSIRFYERVSTTALNSYVGPKLDRYLEQLVGRLAAVGFRGLLLIMQSNGGVMTPEVARSSPALTLLSGPAGGPGAGLFFARAVGADRAITTDMGGTSFEASVAVGAPLVVNDGEIARHKIALPMLDIHSIGAGGGSVGWLDPGGLLRMGPQSAGADPGPACYMKGGTLPASTDANLVLGYLDPAYFAGGRIPLSVTAARAAIERHIAQPMGLTIEAAAAGMFRVVCNNMAQGVREVTIKRGFDPREFPFIAAGGAGPIHSCQICNELEIPLQIVPRESSVLCAMGMLLSDLRHDFVRTFVAPLASLDWARLGELVDDMTAEGDRQLAAERIPPERRRFAVKLDCRYVKQFHEVGVEVPREAIRTRAAATIAQGLHREHNRLYGYSLEHENAPIEVINVRVQATGGVDRPRHREEPWCGDDPALALKGRRDAYVPEDNAFRSVPVYDGHRLRFGQRIAGPAIVEQVTTTIVLTGTWDAIVDRHGSFVLHRKGREDLIAPVLAARRQEEMAQ
ncbi:MAG TPA: hydantoinase/oxoprolinase family protein [Casimicrobiaceae bacterium]|nr:hydantoinase/oxoprolinase family protein [Casimicrobiaceae bacterium]